MGNIEVDEMVRLAIVEDLEWQAIRGGRVTGPRVILRSGDDVERAQRRPFRRGANWFVRYAGTAQLTEPKRNINGVLTFLPVWSW